MAVLRSNVRAKRVSKLCKVLKTDPSKLGRKSPVSRSGSLGGSKVPTAKRRCQELLGRTPRVRLQRAQAPVGRPWPLHELRCFDFPGMGGGLLGDVMKARGWKCSTPCHYKVSETGKSTLYIKEFEAAVRGLTPTQAFGKRGVVEDGYRLQTKTLPKHALWMTGWMPYRVPGTHGERQIQREDFCQIVVENGARLQDLGSPGSYRICKFPGTETALFKTNFTMAFRDKPWYPTTYVLPKEKGDLLDEMWWEGQSRSNYWIAKPRNDYGGAGIRVWHGTDPALRKLVRESDSHPKSVVQRYLADPLLLGGYKFHMRIHLLITCLDPLEAFVQENGQCLFATKPYTISSKNIGAFFDPPVHVTNMGLNTKEENKDNFFRKKPLIGAGQQIRMQQLVAYLARKYPSFDRRRLWGQINQIATDTARYIASARSVKSNGKLIPGQNFELFGMDLMLDQKLKVWMCETNTDPGLDYPDEMVLGEPNPDYDKEAQACTETLHDVFALLGMDAQRSQPAGSPRNWFQLDFSQTDH